MTIQELTEAGHIWEGECATPVANGTQYLCFQTYEKNEGGTEYARFIDATSGEEILYYDNQEWVDDPQLVMGCICAAIMSGANSIPVAATAHAKCSNCGHSEDDHNMDGDCYNGSGLGNRCACRHFS